MSQKIKLFVIIPAYNEAPVVDTTIRSVMKTFKKQPYDTHVIVVDDKSSDNTSMRSVKAGAYVINHIINQGAGGATSTGLRYARQSNADFVITLDADGQHDPGDALTCLKQSILNGTDLMIGSRLLSKGGMSRVKLLGNRGLSFITWLLFRVSVTDSQSGLRVFSRRALDVLEWKSISYDFCSEMIWRAKQKGLSISEHPIRAIYTEYSSGKGQSNWNGLNIVASLVYRRFVELLG